MKTEGKRTAEGVAALRAGGARDPAIRNPDQLAERLIATHLRLLLLPGLRQTARTMLDWYQPGMYLYHQARTKYLDELFLHAIRDVGQVVVLGAGFDTRPYRFAAQLTDRRVFEVDHPGTAAWKKQRLHRLGRSTDHVTYIATDFTRGHLDEELETAGCRLGMPTFFLWEGVTYYLPREAVESTLELVARAAPGSSVAFDYIHRSSLERPSSYVGAARWQWHVERTGEPALFGLDPDEVGPFLEAHGLEAMSNIGPDQLRNLVPPRPVCDFFGIVHARRPDRALPRG